jgi:catabolite regulation protein CreA
MNRILIYTLLAITISCKKAEINQDSISEKNTIRITKKVVEKKISLETFSTFPPEIDGCSCYFSNDSTELSKEKYIFANDLAETSFLKINGKFIKFTQISKIDMKTYEKVKYQSEEYEMNLELKQGKQNGDETTLQSGKLNVKDKSGNETETAFFGECGC